MSQAFDGFSGLSYAKKSLERAFQNFASTILDSVPGLTLQGYPRLHWDFSRTNPKFDRSFSKLNITCLIFLIIWCDLYLFFS